MSGWLRESGALSESDLELIATALADEPEVLVSEQVARARRSALAEVERVLGDTPHTVRHSPLGVEWSGDIDVHVDELPDSDMFVAAGWRDLSDLLSRLGSDGNGRWAVVVDGEVVGAADINLGPAPEATASVEKRVRTGADLRAVLEARVLQRQGVLVVDDATRARLVAAERRLGGRELVGGDEAVSEAIERTIRARRPRPRRPVVSVAFSGVDGAGKSTLIERFRTEMELAGLPVTTIWKRPGHDLGWLDGLARGAKKVLGRQPEPGIRTVASDDAESPPSSRTGRAGRAWTGVVFAEYVAASRRLRRRARGVVIHDRAALDAAVTLAYLYDLDEAWVLPRLRRLTPRVDLHVYLDIDAETAAARKPDDPMGSAAIIGQLDLYERMLADSGEVRRLDATATVGSLIDQVWTELLDAVAR